MKPRNIIIAVLVVGALAACTYLAARHTTGSWEGVDDTVVGKFAEKAGRPATEPFINIEHGDLPLFMFLLAGAAGGFVFGYYFRSLFGRDGRVQTSDSRPQEQPKQPPPEA